MTPRLPVTIVAGFLGAGKTTLVNRLLTSAAGRRVAVLVNDFGAINVDERLISKRSSAVVSLTNGCICCSIQSDLVAQLGSLLDESAVPFDLVVIETSGVSDPGKIARSLGYPQLRERVYLHTVVTVVDALRFLDLSGEARALADGQLAAADLALLNKIDLAEPAQLVAVRDACRSFGVRVIESCYADLSPELLLTPDARPTDEPLRRFAAVGNPHAAFEHWTFEASEPFSLRALRATLRTLPDGVFRAKGFVHLDDRPGTECIVHVVGDRVDLSEGEPWTRPPRSTLVFIGLRGAASWPQLDARLRDCLATRATREANRPAVPALAGNTSR